jgi:hypothetical protein
MTTPHLLNVLVHILAGSAAIVLGLHLLGTLLGKPKDPIHHRRRGRMFVLLTFVVCLTAAIGNAVFRFLPLFAVLTVLVSYQLLSGWHVIYTRAGGPDKLDAGLLLGAAAFTAMLVRRLFADGAMVGAAASVMFSTLGAITMLLAYDAARWLFPRRWHATLWRYEHIYKILGCLFGMLSAAVGNTVKVGQPWSQLAPSVLGMVVVVWCWVRTYRAQRRCIDTVPGPAFRQSGP